MGGCLSRKENLKIKYIPGYEEKVWGKSVEYKEGSKKFHKWGITISVIDDFIEECGGVSLLAGLTTRQVCDQFTKPMMRKNSPSGLGGSYAFWKRKYKSNRGVRDAEIYVVHAWDSVFLDVVDIMRTYVAPLPKRDIITLWFDMLCMNQCHPLKERKQNQRWFKSSFVSGIEECSHVIVAVTPWDNPIVFRRAWCLWEIKTTITSLFDIKLDFALKESDKHHFREAIAEDSPLTIPYNYFRQIDNISLSTSEAFYKRHHKTIMNVCTNSDRHNVVLETEVNECLRKLFKDWVIHEARQIIGEQIESSSEQLDAKIALANIYRHLGRPKDAIEDLQDVYKNRKEMLGSELSLDYEDKETVIKLEKTLVASFLLGNVYRLMGNFDEALPLYEYNLTMCLKLHGANHPQTISILLSLALLYNNQNDIKKEEALYLDMLEIFTEELGEDHEYTILVQNNMGNMYLAYSLNKHNVLPQRINKFENLDCVDPPMLAKEKFIRKKQEYLVKAEAILINVYAKRLEFLGPANPDVLFLLCQLAHIYSRLDRFTSANTRYLQYFLLMKEKYPEKVIEKLTGSESSHASRRRLHASKIACYKNTEVLEAWYLYAKSISAQANSADTIGDSKDKEHQLDEAAHQLELCLHSRKRVLGYKHPDTIKTRDVLLNIWRKKGDYQTIAEYLNEAKEDSIHYEAVIYFHD